MASIFANVEVGPKIEVFALNKLYQEDSSPVKVNLGVGGKLFTELKSFGSEKCFQVESTHDYNKICTFKVLNAFPTYINKIYNA